MTHFDNEPTRSVTFRSAASLAMNCKKYEAAKKMVLTDYQGRVRILFCVYFIRIPVIDFANDKIQIDDITPMNRNNCWANNQ